MESTNENYNYKIYVHINKINGKMYIGQTRQKAELRWRKGLGYQDSPYFWRAIQKYGWDNFDHIILIDNLCQYEADILENELIKKYDTTNGLYGYNLASGGNSPTMNEEAKRHCRENHYNVCGENNPMYGRHHTEETKEKIRKTKEKYVGENAVRYGAVLSEETKQKISASNKGRITSNEIKQKISKSNPTRKPVYQIDIVTRKIIAEFNSINQAHKNTGISANCIRLCCMDEPKYISAGGYIWMLCEDYDKKYFSEEFWSKYHIIERYDENYILIDKFAFPREITKNTGIKNTSYITHLCKQNNFEHIFQGFHWKYEKYNIINSEGKS